MGNFNNSVGSAALSGSLGVVGGLVNAFTSARQAKKNREFAERMSKQQNQFNHDEAELAYKRTVEQWNRENEYNTPSAQFQRMLEAGINPYIAADNIDAGSASSAGASTAATSAGLPSIQNAYSNPTQSFMEGTQGMLDSALKTLTATETGATINGRVNNENASNTPELIKARWSAAQNVFDAQKAEAIFNTAYNRVKLSGAPDIACAEITEALCRGRIAMEEATQAGLDTDMKKIDRKNYNENANLALDAAHQTLDNLKKQGILTRSQYRLLDKQIAYYDTFIKSQIDLNRAQEKQAVSTAAVNWTMNALYPSYYGSQSALNWANARQSNAQTQLIGAQKDYLGLQGDLIKASPQWRYFKHSGYNKGYKLKDWYDFPARFVGDAYLGFGDALNLINPFKGGISFGK